MTILDRLLDEVASARGPISTAELGRRLDVSPSALDGMISVLVRRGKLVGDEAGADGAVVACSGTACGASCVGLEDCVFVASVPTAHRLVIQPAAR